MGKIKIPENYLQIIITVVLAAVVTSIPWLYFYNQKQHLHTMTVSLNEKQVTLLKEQLDQQTTLNQKWVNNLADAQEARVLAETELAGITAQLSQTEEKLSSLDNMEWESKYKFAMLDNETLVEKIAELEFEYDDLLEEDTYLKEQYISDAQKFTQESETLRNDLDKKERELKKQQQLVSKLQEENIKYKNTLAQKKKETVSGKEETQSKIASANNKKTGNTAKAESYRTARIRSLSAAMLNRNSTERKNILVSVIPSIPNGISGNELSSLVKGMDGADILSVIKSTISHINQPLASEAFNQLIKNMNKQDAALASNILSGE